MPFATAKDLRTRTKALIEMVRMGERVVVTHRGRPVAVMSPVADAPDATEDLRPFEQAWTDILRVLKTSRPAFRRPEAALKATRKRP